MSKIEMIKLLRSETGAGVSDCSKALLESGNDVARAKKLLNLKGHEVLSRVAMRNTPQGFICSYIHHNRKVGVMLEMRCETDFAIASLRPFATEVCMQIAATNPDYISVEEIPEKEMGELKRSFVADICMDNLPFDELAQSLVDLRLRKYRSESCLMDQKSVKDGTMTIEDLLAAKSNELHEKVVIKRFCRFHLE